MHSWIGVDLDGTLAIYRGWNNGEIGEPVPAMLARVKQWISEGKCVKIFTARASVPELIPPVKAWLAKHGLPELEVTNMKDFAMVELYDDRCKQVEMNTGRLLEELLELVALSEPVYKPR
jgi:hypothetical protein